MFDAAFDAAAALHGAAAVLALALATWAVASWRTDVSLVDRVWSLLVSAAAAGFVAGAPGPPSIRTARTMAMGVLLAAWALRLAWSITRRNWGHGEDRRYRQIRARHQPHFAWKSGYLVFGLQAMLALLVAAPFLALAGAGARGWTTLDTLGALLAAGGTLLEAVADAQLARFKADPAHAGQVMDRGAWRYSRHPNYFGECCVWWGLWLMALAGGGAWWAIVSPLVMTVLLLQVSGVRLVEADIAERRPGYRDYVARTNAFVPGPPKAAPPARNAP